MTSDAKSFSLDEQTLNEIHLHAASSTSALDQECFYSSMIALLKRTDDHGGERALLALDSADLARILLLTKGSGTKILISATYVKALLEGNGALCRILAKSECVQDIHTLVLALEHADLATALRIIGSTQDGTHHALARYVAMPTIAETANETWLEGLDSIYPPITFALLKRLLILRPDLHRAVHRFLSDHLDILTIGEPDDLLAPLVASATITPEQVLKPFEGIYQHATVIQAASWHLERRAYDRVHTLLEQIPVLNLHYDHALLLRSVAYMECGMDASAKNLARDILKPAHLRQWRLRWAEQHPSKEECVDLLEDARACTQEEPETLYRILLLLLRQGLLAECKEIVASQKDRFSEVSELKSIFVIIAEH